MRPEEIFRLLDAGFTADDIRAMMAQPQPEPTPAPQPQPTPAPQPQPTPAPQPEPTPAPQPEPTPAPQPEPTPAPQPTADGAILAAIQNLTETVKANNILHSNQPPQPQQTASDVIAEIIHPTFKAKDK